jgi:membrane protease YdiL (CAAX protease family)
VKILTPVLALYFLVIIPIIHLNIYGNRYVYEFGHIFYFTLVLTILLTFKHISIQKLGFNKHDLGKTLTIGSVLLVLPVIGVFLLDGLLIKMELAESELFVGSELRNPEEMGLYSSTPQILFNIFLAPVIDQVFIIGLIMNNLFTQKNTGRDIVGGGLLYSLLHFNLGIGNLILGMISTGLMRLTGSIIVSIMVHVGFAIAELSIVFHFPRLISMLVFFV